MKTLVLVAFCVCSMNSFSQDSVKIKQIDSLVMLINKSKFNTQCDSIIQDHQDLGLYMKTYLTMVTNERELKKYVNNVHATRNEDGITKQMTSTNIFYYDKNKLIKVEEFIIEDGKENSADWYYSEEKPLYYTFKSDKSEDRANLLLNMAKVLVKQLIK